MARRYSLPTFNLEVGIWRWGVNYLTQPPSVSATGQLKAGFRGTVSSVVQFADRPGIPMVLLLPALTDVRDAYGMGNFDIVEVPLGSGRRYRAIQVDDVAKGFTNEYRFALLQQFAERSFPLP